MVPRGSKRKFFILAIGYFALVATLILAGYTSAFKRFDLWLLDHEMAAMRWRAKQPAQEVALIGIDEDTLRAFDEPLALWHRHFAALLQVIAQLKPIAVGLDVVLPERSYDSIVPGYDRELTRALVAARSAYPLVLGITIDSAGHARALLPAFEAAVGMQNTGLVLWPVDADHAVRRFDERLAEGGRSVPTLTGQLARKLGKTPGHGLIDYTIGAPLNYVAMHTLLAAERAGRIEQYKPEIAGKVVLIGPIFELEDRKPQPINVAAWEQERADAPGLLLHAQALRSILNDGLITPVASHWTVALSVAMLFLWLFPMGIGWALVVLGIGISGLLGAALVLLNHGLYLETGAALVALVLAVITRVGYEAIDTHHQRRRLRAALSGYVSPHIAEQVVKGQFSTGFAGQRYFLCVMFADMRDFTPRSERMAPEDVIRLVNRCFEEMVSAIHQFGGTVVQFMGDGIEAFFGAPNRLENPARPAFDAARELFRRMEILNAQLEREGIEAIRLGVGLNLGDAIVGHVGSQSRHGYQPIGDMVNVASRIEGLSKELGYSLVCSARVAEALGDGSGLVPLGEHTIKGHSPVSVFGWRPVGSI